MVIAENARQNLIAASTIADFRARHIDDALQLLPLLSGSTVLDIGSGAGIPGIVLACVRSNETILVEPRKRRAAFLQFVVENLGLGSHATVIPSRIEAVRNVAPTTITARAVTSLDRLFAAAEHLSDDGTRWVLPKGRTAQDDLAKARETWQGDFSLIPSVTDPTASIVVAERVRRRG